MLVSSKLQTFLLKQPIKFKRKSNKLEIIYENAIYICIFSYSKICWFLVKSLMIPAKLKKSVTWFAYFLDFYWVKYKLASFIVVEYVWQILGRFVLSIFAPNPSTSSVSSPKKTHPNTFHWNKYDASGSIKWQSK